MRAFLHETAQHDSDKKSVLASVVVQIKSHRWIMGGNPNKKNPKAEGEKWTISLSFDGAER